jgi:putative transposase
VYNECVISFHTTHSDDTRMPAIFHPLLALIASAADRQLARYVEFLKADNKILRTRVKGQAHTKPDERRRLLQFGKALNQAIEELITIITPATFYRWIRDENEPETKRPKGGSRKPAFALSLGSDAAALKAVRLQRRRS